MSQQSLRAEKARREICRNCRRWHRWEANGKPSNGHKQPGADVERFRELYRQQKQGANNADQR